MDFIKKENVYVVIRNQPYDTNSDIDIEWVESVHKTKEGAEKEIQEMLEMLLPYHEKRRYVNEESKKVALDNIRNNIFRIDFDGEVTPKYIIKEFRFQD